MKNLREEIYLEGSEESGIVRKARDVGNRKGRAITVIADLICLVTSSFGRERSIIGIEGEIGAITSLPLDHRIEVLARGRVPSILYEAIICQHTLTV